MSIRVKSRWHQTKRIGNQTKIKSMQDMASALAFNCWRIAGNSILELENQGYHTTSNQHRLEIMAEYLAFLLQVCDRLLYDKFTAEQRQIFIPALALDMARIFADNKTDLLGSGEHVAEFIDFLNQRGDNYAEFSFIEGAENFEFLRLFAEYVAQCLPLDNSLWVSQFVLEVDTPQVLITLNQAIKQLFNVQFK
jgi:hypothetical protein